MPHVPAVQSIPVTLDDLLPAGCLTLQGFQIEPERRNWYSLEVVSENKDELGAV